MRGNLTDLFWFHNVSTVVHSRLKQVHFDFGNLEEKTINEGRGNDMRNGWLCMVGKRGTLKLNENTGDRRLTGRQISERISAHARLRGSPL